MSFCNNVVFVKLHGLTSESGRALNGTTGRLGLYYKDHNGIMGNNHYEVFFLGSKATKSVMVKVKNLYPVDSQWIDEVRKSPMKIRMHDMMNHFSAPGIYPCPIAKLQQPSAPLEQLLSWFGADVFSYIFGRMQWQRLRRGWINWEMDQAITTSNLWLAAHHWEGMLWPTIVFPLPASYRDDHYGSYCQGLALEEAAKPWIVPRRNLVIYCQYGAQPQPPPPINISAIPSTVTIEEMTVESDDSSWTDLGNSTLYDCTENRRASN